MEIWKDIKGYEGIYSISNLGNVKRVFTYKSGKTKVINISAYVSKFGYKEVMLSAGGGKQKLKRIHQLLAESFLNHEPCGYKVVVDHIDNNPFNNDLSNLQLISHRENLTKDSWRHRKGDVKSRGVSRHLNRFNANICLDGTPYYLGSFSSELKASEAYEKSLQDYNNGCFDAKKYTEFKPSSEHKYVSWHKGNSMWQVLRTVNYKIKHYGYFHCEIEASLKAQEITKNPHQ